MLDHRIYKYMSRVNIYGKRSYVTISGMITNPEKNSRMGSRDKYLSHGIAKGVRCLCICKCKEFEISGGGGGRSVHVLI